MFGGRGRGLYNEAGEIIRRETVKRLHDHERGQGQ